MRLIWKDDQKASKHNLTFITPHIQSQLLSKTSFFICFMLFNWKYERLTRKNKFKLYLFVFLFLRSHFETRKSKNKTLSLICLRGFGKFLSVEAIIRLSVEDILRCEMSTCQDNISVKQLKNYAMHLLFDG